MKRLYKTGLFACLTGIYLTPTTSLAQAPDYSWATGIGSTGADQGVRMVTDAAGNSYTTGSFTGTVDFNPAAAGGDLTAAGGTDIFVCKLDAAGNFVWAVNMGGTGDDAGQALAVDASGNVYLTGVFRNTADFNLALPGTNTLTSVGMGDIFVCKLNSLGAYSWVVGTGSINDDGGTSLALDATNNLLVAGNFGATTTVDFNTGAGTDELTSFGSSDDFVWKLDNSGTHIFVKQIGCNVNDLCNGMALDASGNIYLTGSFNGTTDFDPHPVNTFTLTSAGSNDIFICKLNAAGDFQWAARMGTFGTEIGNSVVVDNAGNVLFTGSFANTTNFDPLSSPAGSVTASGLSDPFVCKFNAAGGFIWVKSFTGSGFDRGHSLTVDGSNNVYNSGSFANTMDFDPSSSTAFNLTAPGTGIADAYVAVLNSSGNFLWAINVGGSGDESGQSVKLSSGNIYLAGRFSTTADFNPDVVDANTLTSAGSTDIFVAKYEPSCIPTTHTITASSCDDYTLNSNTYTTTGTYTQTLTNVAGCDSTITLNLTINQPTTHTITTTECDSYTLNGDTYTASGTYTQIIENVAGCDSTITLNLTLNQSSTNDITVTACNEYILNSNAYTTTGTYNQTLLNAEGCDSVITLHLTIDPMVNLAVTVTGATITATATGATYQWINCTTLAPIAGETSQSFTATSNGSYAVVVTAGTCSDTSACTSFTTIGMDEPGNTQFVQFSPNPASETVLLSSTQPANGILVDMTGKTVLVFDVQKGNNTINISQLNQGVYILHLNGETTGLRLVKL
jgi:hypothetical protein